MVEASVMNERRDDYVEHGLKMLNDETRLIAGLEYTNAIMSLGLDPDLMCWVYLPDEDRTELSIVTTMVDRVGPAKLYSLLFKAYQLSATPREVDPFEVGLYSPRTALGLDLLSSIRIDDQGVPEWARGDGPAHIWHLVYYVGLVEMKVVSGKGIYRVKKTRRNADQDHAKWTVLSQNVEALAA